MNDYVSERQEPSMEPFSRNKKYVTVNGWEVAYAEAGQGRPLILLHGCPFQSYEWSDVIPILAARYHVIAPDLLGLGDTRVTLTDDYSLPKQVQMVTGLLDALNIDQAFFVGHDHGAATLQLLMVHYPQRITKAVLTNAEAYDQWPSREERPYVKAVVSPVTTGLIRLALGFRPVQRRIFRSAVVDPATLTDEVLYAFLRPHLASPARWQRLRRFFRYQLDPHNNRQTLEAVTGLRRFRQPTLILWGRQDVHFGPPIAHRLANDIPGVRAVRFLEHSAHLPMLEEPQAYAGNLMEFFEAENA